MKEGFFQVQTTLEHFEQAREMAAVIVEKRLGACCQILPGMVSHYSWEGVPQEVEEVLLLIKTTGNRLEELTDWLEENHPYEIPEIIALPIQGISEGYALWIQEGLSA